MFYVWISEQTAIISAQGTNLMVHRRFRKATLSLIMPVHLSVHMEKLGSQKTNFQEILCLRIFRKCVEKLKFN
jgi:hypothetical protein